MKSGHRLVNASCIRGQPASPPEQAIDPLLLNQGKVNDAIPILPPNEQPLGSAGF